MNCPRCQGFMVEDFFIDLQESMGPHWVTGWRCMNCGNVIDPVIAVNRLWVESARSTAVMVKPCDEARPVEAKQAA